MIDIGLCGATGKMGQAVIGRIDKFTSCRIAAKFNSSNDLNRLEDLCKNSDVVIDFSSTDILEKLVHLALIHKTKLVLCTTGLSDSHVECINKAAKTLPILYSANMSVGANLLAHLAKVSAKILKEYDTEILEIHHRDKKDAPSGTAIMLREILAEGRGRNSEHRGICISSIRGGKVFGEHEVLFLGDDEIITIKHQALNRNGFADGAILAAKWIIDKPSGLYSMLDVFKNDY